MFIMKKKLVGIFIAFFLVLSVSLTQAQAAEICSCSSIAGDNDNLGRTCCLDVTHEPDDGDFDLWDASDKSWTHTFSQIASGNIVKATLTVFNFNINDKVDPYYDLKLFIDGVEIPNAFDEVQTTLTFTSVFELDSSLFSVLEDGSALVEIKNAGTHLDSFAVDYAVLDIDYYCTIPVTIDIKPGSDPSSFGANSNGKIPVALFGSATFDVTQIDDTTVRFGDIEEAGAYTTKVGLEDINSDGYMDKVYHFAFPETNLDAADTIGYLSGSLLNGTKFVGSSDVNIVGNTSVTVAPDEEIIEVDDEGKKVKMKVKK
jgi:hypothetical protein